MTNAYLCNDLLGTETKEKKKPCFSFLHSGGKRAEGAANEQMGVTRSAPSRDDMAATFRPFKVNLRIHRLA